MKTWTVAALALLTLTSCQREQAGDRPEDVVEELVDRMQRVHGDPKTSREAYELLWKEAKRNLAERAKRASALSGRKIAPEEMLAPSRFSLRFRPKHYESKISGDWAEVTAVGEDPASQRSVIKCVLEDEAWRVVVELPPLPPIQIRPDQDDEKK